MTYEMTDEECGADERITKKNREMLDAIRRRKEERSDAPVIPVTDTSVSNSCDTGSSSSSSCDSGSF